MSFTVYKSSAGSGKTFTLVKEYLKLALSDMQDPPVKYRRILAITFTNKAAAEMKERVLRALKELSSTDKAGISTGSATLLNELVKETGLSPELLSERAGIVLEAILHNYSEFAIGTIDSFVHRVVRTFAFDLRIPMNFEIETDADKLLTQAIDLLISQVGNDEQLTRALVEFTESKTDDEKSWHIEHDLKRFAANLLKEDGTLYIDRLRSLTLDDFFELRTTLVEEVKKFEEAVKEPARKANKLISMHDLDPAVFYQGNKGIAGYFSNVAKGRFDMLRPNSYVRTTLGEDKWTGGKASARDKAAMEEIKPRLIDLFTEIQEIVEANYSDYIVFALINRNIYSLAVLNEIEKLLVEFKTQNNILHISEFNRIISGIVLSQPVPFIYERLGEKYNHYLIDEFQDTSLLQWHNLLPLIDNSLGESHFNMIVGDGKQAIYRWRGGEVEQFARLPEIHRHDNNPYVTEREDTLKRNHNPRHLGKNFRSKREVIEFNNVFFRTLSDKLDNNYRSIYDQLEQEFDPRKTGGHISVEFIEGEKEALHDAHLARTHELVLKLRADNFALKDIAVLVRRNTDGSEIARYLTQKGIPVVSSDSLLLKTSHAVTFMAAFLEYLADQGNNIAKTTMLEYLLVTGRISDNLHNAILNAVNQTRAAFREFLEKCGFKFNTYFLGKLPLYELCEETIRLFGLNRHADPYVQFFLDEVLSWTQKNINNLNDFLDWWNEPSNNPSIAVPGATDAVTIMTIHRSKGLEFPAVIIPFASWRVMYGNDNLWIDVSSSKIPKLQAAIVPTTAQLEETEYAPAFLEEKNKSLLDHMNVLYVGMTRPEERLYMLTGTPSKNPENLGSITDMLAYYFIQSGQWEAGKTTYEFGTPALHVDRMKQFPYEPYTLTSANSTNWRERIKIRISAPDTWETEDPESHSDKDVTLKKALSMIYTLDDIDKVIAGMFNEGLLSKDEKGEYLERLNWLLTRPGISPYFVTGLQVKAGSDILVPSGESYKPERVIIEQNRVTVMDFIPRGKGERHKKNLDRFASLLREMGFENVEKRLIRLEEESIEVVI
jgi:ATP-dependent exoDNAse (exonuclease V) beta subunit